MKIYKSDGTLLLEVDVDDTSYRSRQIMGDHLAVLNFSLATYADIPVGSYIDYGNTRFTLLRPHNVKMQHSRDFEYSVTFHTDAERAKTWIFKNPADGRISFSLAATPREHLQMFVNNMNRRDSGWTVGECVSGEEKLISYDQLYCSDALALMASELNTEYEINGKTVSLKKVEYNKGNPLALSYGGTGNGFKAGISRSNGNGDLPLEILYIQGGEQNIDYSKYGSRTLLLPKEQTVKYDGSKFEDEEGYVAANARTYIVSVNGDYIQRQDKALASMTEASLDLSDIYPSRVGTVKEVITIDEDNNFYDFTDLDDPSDPCPNYGDCLIGGEQMTVIFQTGRLAGREFDVKYHHDSVTERGVEKKARRFEIVPAEMDGETMPNDTFKPAAGDKYIVFHCQLPDDYIRKDSSKSGASWRMFRDAVRYMYDNEDYKFTFNGTLDGIWAKNDWVNIGAKIKLGGYVSFTDPRFQPDPVLIRITDIKDYINNPHSPEITVSNETVSAGFGSAIKKIEGGKVELEAKMGNVTSYTKRGFRDAMETSRLLEEAMIEGYTQSISPVTARMMQLIVGDERLQFEFMSAYSETATAVSPSFVFDYATGKFTVSNPSGAEYIARHLSLDRVDMTPQHSYNTYYFWGVHKDYDFSVGTSPNKAYYVYLECPKYVKDTEVPARKDAGTYYAAFILSETPKPAEADDNHYFLAGILTSEYGQSRSFSQLYGFTEITGGRITTDRIVSRDGNTYFDLEHNTIAGTIQFLQGLITGLIGIGNDTSINAGMSGDGSSATDIRIWAGKGIVDRASAPFRVQHDGKMYASDAVITGKVTTPELTATGGTIGGFTITNTSLTNADKTSSASITVNKLNSGELAAIGTDVTTGLGLNIHSPAVFKSEKSRSYYETNAALVLSASGVPYFGVTDSLYGSHALMIMKGYTTGFNPRIRRIGSNYTITQYDTVIAVSTSSNITITFPRMDSEFDGKWVVVKKYYGGTIRLVSDEDCKLHTHTDVTELNPTWAEMIMAFWDAVNEIWVINTINGWGE